MAIGTDCVSARVPAAASASRISSVAYALDESASDEKTASALIFGRRCSSRCSDEIGAPTATLRMRRQTRSPVVRGAVARSVARNVPSSSPR